MREYFHILEDTYLGFFLEPFKNSLRKRVHQAPKFYLFDVGINRSLAGLLDLPLKEGTSAYGDAFEHFVILELMRAKAYAKKNVELFYFATENSEVDLIVKRAGKPLAVVETKSTSEIRADKVTNLVAQKNAFTQAKFYCLSQDPRPKEIDGVNAMPWQMGLQEIMDL